MLISNDLPPLTEIDFVVQLQTLHKIFTPEKNILKTLTATTFNHKVGQNIILAVL